MYYGDEQRRQKHIKFLMEQYAFLQDPQPVVPYLPDTVDIDIANRCNLRCISCFHVSRDFKALKDMTWETFEKVVEQAEGRATAVTIGNHGEPFLHRQALEMLAELKRRGFFVNLINNGTRMFEETARKVIELGIDRVVFSVDSVDPDVYGNVRVHGTYEVTMTNVLTFLKLNYEAGMPCYVNISMVDTPTALKSKVDLFDYFAQLPVHVSYISPMLNFQDSLEIREQTKFVKLYGGQDDPSKWPVCVNGFDRILIRPSGEVSLCAIDWNRVHILGNIHDTPYYELWNNDKAQEFRRGLITRDYRDIERNGTLCSKCDAKWACEVGKHQDSVVTQIAGNLRDAKQEITPMVATEERYHNLLRELDRIEARTAEPVGAGSQA